MPATPHDALAAQLAALVTDLHRHDQGLHTELSKLIDHAGRDVPGAQYVGITSAHRQHGVRTVVSTHRHAAVLDEIQDHHQEGPCLTAAWEHATVRIDDLIIDGRWPRYRHDVLDRTPIRSVLAFELFTTNDAMRALNFYADQPRAFTEESLELGLVFATNIALAWAVLERNEQFRSALASRDLIGQAKGMIMERYHVDAVHAFELLKKLSQQSNLKLAEVSERLINTVFPDPSDH